MYTIRSEIILYDLHTILLRGVVTHQKEIEIETNTKRLKVDTIQSVATLINLTLQPSNSYVLRLFIEPSIAFAEYIFTPSTIDPNTLLHFLELFFSVRLHYPLPTSMDIG